MHRLSGLAVQDVEVAVLARLGERLHALPAHLHVEQDRLVAGVVVPDVVMHLLVVPLQRAGAQREREDRIGEQVRADPLRAVAERIADGDVDQPELGIDRRRLPDAAAVALAADPGRAGDVPALIPSVLRNGVEVPEHLAGLRVDRQHVTAGNVALAARAADVDHAVVNLRRGREPVAERDRRRDVGIALLDHVEDDAGLAVLAEGLDRLAGLRVEREQKRSGAGVDDAVGVADAAVAEDVAGLRRRRRSAR